jgi:GDP-D-mannose dehydratase
MQPLELPVRAGERVLITGAAGRIGVALTRHLYARHALRLADINVDGLDSELGEIVALDITNFESCLRACEGITIVVHLASNPATTASFTDSVLPVGIEGTYNVFEAASRKGCDRLVFASSAQVVEGYALDTQIQESFAPRPKNLYGVGKAFGEALASYYASEKGLVAVAVRIANLATFQAGEVHSPRDVSAFVSERDLNDLLQRCVEAPLVGFHVVHGVSNNTYKRLGIDATRKLLDYAPNDNGFRILFNDEPVRP